MKLENNPEKSLKNAYGNRLRVRVCGLLVEGETILLANHKGLNTENEFWCPPGGGVNIGESLEMALKREFMEECHLKIQISNYLGTYQYIKNNLHAIEVFFVVSKIDGEMALGHDPETGNEILTELKLWTTEELKKLPNALVHPIIIDLFYNK